MTTDTSSGGSESGARGSQWRTWFGLFGGIAAWTLHLAIAYPLVYNGCAMGLAGLSTWLLILTAVLGLVALVATLMAYRTWRTADAQDSGDAGGTLGARRLLGVMGTGLSGLSLLIMIFSAIAIVGLGPCYYINDSERVMHSFSLLLHQTPLLAPQTLWEAWNWEPFLLLALLLPGALYLWGTARCWQARAGVGRGVHWRHMLCLLGGLTALMVALLSPLDALSEALFSAHMVQHLLLLLVAPPLFVLARPLVPWLWALPSPLRHAVGVQWRRSHWLRAGWRILTLPPLVWLLHTTLLWTWHTPLLYQSALRYETVHVLEHLCFFGAALLLWWTVLDPPGGQRSYGISILALFLTALQGGILGALLTFSPTLWYPIYAPLTAPWGLTPLADQQLAGVIMWVPSGFVYLGAVLGLFVAWLAAVERGMRLRERTALDMQLAGVAARDRAHAEGG